MGSSNPILSIVTPVYNLVSAGRSDVFRQCAESVCEQAARVPLEHLVVDSCSSDGTDELLAPYAKCDYCRIIEKRDRSVYEGMNNGLHEAKGKYVLFLNSDDYLVSGDALKVAVDDLEAKGADYSYGDVNVIDETGNFLRKWVANLDELPFASHYSHQSMLVRRDLLLAYGGFDLQYRISADSDLMLHLYRENRTCIKNRFAITSFRTGGLAGENWRQAKQDHSTAFYGYFGKEVGLTLEECRALWQYDGIGALPYDACEHILTLLPDQAWREKWLARMHTGYKGKKKAIRRNGIVSRIKAKFKNGGVADVVRTCVRKVMRVGR